MVFIPSSSDRFRQLQPASMDDPPCWAHYGSSRKGERDENQDECEGGSQSTTASSAESTIAIISLALRSYMVKDLKESNYEDQNPSKSGHAGRSVHQALI
jgi:hypothetical protein